VLLLNQETDRSLAHSQFIYSLIQHKFMLLVSLCQW